MIDLSTKAGVLRFCELRRAEMVGCLRKLGRFESNGHSFSGYAFMRHEISVDVSRASKGLDAVFRTGPKLDRVEALPLNLPPEEDLPEAFVFEKRTSWFGAVIQAFAKAGKADGVLVFGEGWFVQQSLSEPAVDQPYGWVAKHPDRGEGLWMKLEHKTVGYRNWVCVIQRSGPLIELTPWAESSEPPDGSARLTDLVDWRS